MEIDQYIMSVCICVFVCNLHELPSCGAALHIACLWLIMTFDLSTAAIVLYDALVYMPRWFY